VKSGTFVQKLHCDAREKFTGNNELIKTRSARTSRFDIPIMDQHYILSESTAPNLKTPLVCGCCQRNL
jgi:hypothetical protein